jgi:hypothetical protein
MSAAAINNVEHRKTCHHEAGHAAAAMMLGLDVEGVHANRIDVENPPPRGTSIGATGVRRPDITDIDSMRTHALMVLAGPMNEGKPDWPPRWPLPRPTSQDEHDLSYLVTMMDMEEPEYSALVKEAKSLVARPEFNLLQMGVAHLLEAGHRLDRSALSEVKAIVTYHRKYDKSIAPGSRAGYTTFPARIRTKSVEEPAQDAVHDEVYHSMYKALRGLRGDPVHIATFEC